jgi:hypothetical protein
VGSNGKFINRGLSLAYFHFPRKCDTVNKVKSLDLLVDLTVLGSTRRLRYTQGRILGWTPTTHSVNVPFFSSGIDILVRRKQHLQLRPQDSSVLVCQTDSRETSALTKDQKCSKCSPETPDTRVIQLLLLERGCPGVVCEGRNGILQIF